ncbi:leucine zipper protein 1-like [Oncorhynchus keta]|uniref:leucine zipper protein 1-like n=1 Tax=Oncorhynchus keta TaxID=8018 RepID=UPI0015F79095|nr:leucine zipper protein 1-like [Oncorhynchus keta]XP_052341831.1 leucine zipper protein 1-like [Oncorhynchus keta]
MSENKDITSRHLQHKLQSLGRRLDELEEATNKLQKSEDELLDLQDKIIQAEGSNSSMLGDVEGLRKRLLKIEGKDEEVCKAEDLCRMVREKLEEEESLTQDLKSEIECLQRRMAELEKLEEAFSKSKSDCSQLCLSLNEEKNLTRKLSSEMEALKDRVKEVDMSEVRLDRAEMFLAGELEKLKGLTQTFLSERKRLLEKQKDDEKLILKLTEKLERQNRIDPVDPRRIEDDLSSGLTGKLGRKKSLDYLKLGDEFGLRNKSENEKNRLDGQEDNKVKELTQEVERLKNRLKQLELVEEDLKNTESKNGELQEKFQQERSRSRALNDQVEQLRIQLCGGSSHGNGGPSSPAKVLENGKAENEEINVRGGFRQVKPKYRPAAEPATPKYKSRELSPQHKMETKLRSKELSNSEESSPKSVRRALSPAHKSRRTPKTGTSTASDNGVKEIGRGVEEKTTRGAAHTPVGTSLSDRKKLSVLSRYPPAANDQKPWKISQKPSESESKKCQVDTFSRLYVGSDSESNNSDVVPESSSKSNSVSPLEKGAFASDLESVDQVQEALPVSNLSKANGSYIAYKSHVSPMFSDHGSEGHSSASETESPGSRPSEPEPVPEVTALSSRTSTTPKCSRYSRIQDSQSEGSSTRSSIDEEQHRLLVAEGESLEPTHTPSGIELRRVCSPREALRSKAVIKPAIVEIDRKEVMISGGAEPLTSSNGKPKISTKPVLTSSITIYPNDPNSSRTSSRSSSVSSEPPVKERHTSTSNIVIGPSEHRGSISIPYEISIPKREITPWPSMDGPDESGVLGMACAETHLLPRSNFSLQSPETTSDFNNDTESGFESSSSSTTTVTSWRSQHHGHHTSQDDSLPEMRNVTVRSTWKNRGAASVDEPGRGARMYGMGSEDEAESATTWRAYRATTILDTEETVNATRAATSRTAKPSPAELYMRRINNSVVTTRDIAEPVCRSKSSLSPTEGGLRMSIPHEPVSSQKLVPWRTQPMAADDTDPNPGSWRTRPAPGDLDHYESERSSRTDVGSSRGMRTTASRPALLSNRGHAGLAEGRTGRGNRQWSNRQTDD